MLIRRVGSLCGQCPVRSLADPPGMLGVRCGGFEPKGELIPLSNQLSGAVGGELKRAHLDRQASLRAVSAGGASSTNSGPRRRQCCGDASGCRGGGAARCDGEELVSSHAKGLCSVET